VCVCVCGGGGWPGVCVGGSMALLRSTETQVRYARAGGGTMGGDSRPGGGGKVATDLQVWVHCACTLCLLLTGSIRLDQERVQAQE
jgi:hypothetical protein